MAINYDEETIYLRKLKAFLEGIAALASWDIPIVFADTLKDAIAGNNRTVFRDGLIVVYRNESDPVLSHNKIVDWTFTSSLTVIVKREFDRQAYIRDDLASSSDGRLSLTVIDGILHEEFRGETLNNYLLRLDLGRGAADPVAISESPERVITAPARTYQVTAIKEVRL